MHTALKAVMASTLALATAWPAAAQYQPTPQYAIPYLRIPPYQYRPTPQYQEDLQRYQQERSDYDARQQSYRAAREEYQRRLDAYNRASADYDARYGYGAYARIYGPAPVWSESNWAYYAPPSYPPAAYPPAAYAPAPVAPAAPYYGANTAYATPPIHCDNSGAVTAGVLGAIAGAVLGSNVAARNARTEGAVLGGVVGAGLGAAVGHAHDRYKCDSRGAYFAYSDTIPYDEGPYPSDRYAEYQRMGCRLASAPVDPEGREYRYVRVCPDPDGRYRLVG